MSYGIATGEFLLGSILGLYYVRAMNLAKYYVALVLLLAVLAGMIWNRSHRDQPMESAASAEVQTAEPVQVAANGEVVWKNESHWLVHGITQDLAQMVAFAAKGETLDPASVETTVTPDAEGNDGFSVSVKSPAGKTGLALKLQHHFWAPENYLPLAAALIKEAQLKPTTASSDGAKLPATLTSPESKTLIAESKRLSAELSKQPLDASLHEEAALVIGTLAFRESSGRFNEVRPALGRMTAHLALARALNATPGPCGNLAELIQLTLVNRQTEAVERAAKLDASLSAWAMALRLRNTGDWRLLPKPESATLLEQIAYAQALISSRDPSALAAFLEAAKPKNIPDWGRLALTVSFSVQEGHMFATNSVGQEFMDLEMTRKAYSDERLAEDKVADLLNEPESNGAVRKEGAATARFEVLSWGTLAAFHQRHLMHVVDRTHHFFSEKWGVPDAAAELLSKVSALFGKLTLYPLLKALGTCTPGELADAREKAAEFCRTHQPLMTASMWGELEGPTFKPNVVCRPVPAYLWFGNVPLIGTAFDFCARECESHTMPVATAAEAVKIAPYDFHVLHAVADHLGAADYGSLSAVFKSIIDYHVGAQRYVAKQLQDDPKAYAQAMEKVAALDPDAYVTLGRHLVNFGMADEAAKAFEKAVAKANDQVMVANNCEWLINYYMDRDRRDDAVKVANVAAEVYSFRGLNTAGRLMVRLERWDKALELFSAIAERYNDSGPLLQFLDSHQSDTKLKARYDQIIGEAFKGGLKKVALADFKDEPASGTKITSASEHTQQYNLKTGDVIVALDGVRVDDLDQYFMVRAMKKDEEPVQIIYWDGTSYHELSASLPQRRFGCTMEPYKK